MSGKFLRPPKQRSSYPKYSDHVNKSVNILNVVSVSIGRQNYYPDNKGIPTVIFDFVGGGEHQWYLDTDNEASEALAAIEQGRGEE